MRVFEVMTTKFTGFCLNIHTDFPSPIPHQLFPSFNSYVPVRRAYSRTRTGTTRGLGSRCCVSIETMITFFAMFSTSVVLAVLQVIGNNIKSNGEY